MALYFLTWERGKVARVLRCYNVFVFIFIFYFLNIVLTWKIVVPAEVSVIYIYIYIDNGNPIIFFHVYKQTINPLAVMLWILIFTRVSASTIKNNIIKMLFWYIYIYIYIHMCETNGTSHQIEQPGIRFFFFFFLIFNYIYIYIYKY